MSWQLVPFDDAELTPEEQAQVAAVERMLDKITGGNPYETA
ncbi:hypothetical protein [Sporosarcina obsidiansis]|nr:hypothetical protein [Sporosarcina obsidiansis]